MLRLTATQSTCYHLPAARCAYETVGPDKFIFGTDAPPLWKLKTRGVQMIRDLKLSPENERKVFSDNAKQLLKL